MSPCSATSASPSAETGTDRSRVSPSGKKLRETPLSRVPGPRSNPRISEVANCSPDGTNTGSGTRICPVGSKK